MNNICNTLLQEQDPNISTILSKPHTWTVSTINIQGLIEDAKRDLWFTYLSQSPIDICIYAETNGKDQTTNKWKISGYKL